MADSSFDCYLCGTENPASAEYCVKCSGQLLKIADAPAETGEAVESELPDSFENPFATDELPGSTQPTPQKPSRKVHASIEDQRLSDALGLTEDVDEPAPAQPQPTVASAQPPQQTPGQAVPGAQPLAQTSRPSATAVAPALNVTTVDGDPRGSIFSSRGDEEVGPIAWVIVAMLFIAVGWFGYSTLVRTPDRPTPESIGFVAETTTLPPTTTTAAPEVELVSAREVDSEYNSSLVRLVPFQCEAGVGEQNGDPLVGVAINSRSVVVAPGLPAGTNAVRIVTRTGATRVAILSQQAGVTVATSNARTNRNLEIEEFGNDTAFFVHYDLEENDVFVTETSENAGLEVEVSEAGLIHRVRVGQTTVSAEDLAAIDLEIEIDEDLVRRGSSTCNLTAGFGFAPPVTAEPVEEADSAEDTENE